MKTIENHSFNEKHSIYCTVLIHHAVRQFIFQKLLSSILQLSLWAQRGPQNPFGCYQHQMEYQLARASQEGTRLQEVKKPESSRHSKTPPFPLVLINLWSAKCTDKCTPSCKNFLHGWPPCSPKVQVFGSRMFQDLTELEEPKNQTPVVVVACISRAWCGRLHWCLL